MAAARTGAILPRVTAQLTDRRPAAASSEPSDPDLEPLEDEDAHRRPLGLAILLIVGGALGLLGAFELTLDKFAVLTDPHASLNCNLSVLVQCGKNLGSKQGAAFGFPNPVLGLMGFPAPIAVGLGVLSGARFGRWFWALFNLGMAGALAFVAWLITVSVFQLHTLCPWCMLVWVAVIPMVVAVTLHDLRVGNLPLGRIGRRVGAAVYGWTPLISLIAYLAIAVVAQVRLDVLHRI